MFVETQFRIKIRRSKIFDVYIDWHHIRREAYAAAAYTRVLNIDLYELVHPPQNTPAVVYFEVME